MSKQPSEVDAVQEELVAYLDGELDSTAVMGVERRLADDAEYRERLRELQQTWDLLDHLPRSQVEQSFTHDTLKLVTLNAEEDVQKSKTFAARWRQVAWVAGAACALAAAWGGYLLVSGYVSRPNDELVKDLPLLENVDLYKHAESVEFLRSLQREGLFAQEVEDAL